MGSLLSACAGVVLAAVALLPFFVGTGVVIDLGAALVLAGGFVESTGLTVLLPLVGPGSGIEVGAVDGAAVLLPPFVGAGVVAGLGVTVALAGLGALPPLVGDEVGVVTGLDVVAGLGAAVKATLIVGRIVVVSVGACVVVFATEFPALSLSGPTLIFFLFFFHTLKGSNCFSPKLKPIRDPSFAFSSSLSSSPFASFSSSFSGFFVVLLTFSLLA